VLVFGIDGQLEGSEGVDGQYEDEDEANALVVVDKHYVGQTDRQSHRGYEADGSNHLENHSFLRAQDLNFQLETRDEANS
jgi:hypothetical protein